MSCPNLRTFNPTPLYNHTFTRLFHALSTRPHIREHSWLIAPNSEATTRSHTQLSNLLSPQQTVLFLHSHARWKELSHLAIHALPGAILESRLLERLFNRLPNLTHLSLANLDEDDFTSTTLLRVPPLLSLRLTNLPGITSTGIAQWASTPQAQCLRWLGLFDVPVREMGVLAKLLARLKALKELMLVQKEEPVHEEEVVFHPLLVSPSLEKITWDCRPGIPAARPETRTEDIDQAPRRGRRGSIQFSRDSFDTSGLSNRAESRDRAGLVSGTGTSTPTPFYTPLSTVPSGSHSSTPTLPSLRHSLPTIPTQTSYFPAFAPALLSPTGTPRDSSPASFVPSTSSPKTPKAPLDSSDLPTPDSTATTLLALSITHAGLPALKQLRTASDPSGALQSVCVPRFSFLARGDRFHPATRLDPAEYNQTLHAARKGAEGRARAARDGSVQAGKKRGCEIRVGDDGGEDGSGGDGNRVGNGEEEGEGRVLARGGWVGVWPGLGGGVEYVLEERGRVGVEIGIDGRGKREGKGRCNGNWNAAHGKGRKWWGHVERERDWGSVGGMEGLWS
ncbi:MAG: hypothetical protein MMC23_001895 [Stictis urceolatum]|nr:hypothetical protein [Stictis urceolata]